MNLTEELRKASKGFKEKAPQEVKNEMLKAHEEIVAKKIGNESIAVNDIFPDFELSNQTNKKITLTQLLKEKKFLIISFYRGGWCPYCNLELRALQEKKSEFDSLGAGLVAITPEKPDQSLSTSEKNNLSFEVLSDDQSELAQKIGISFELPENLKPIYEKFGIDIPKHNGENNFTLPIPATFLVGTDKKILYAFKELDYTLRLDLEEIIKKISN